MTRCPNCHGEGARFDRTQRPIRAIRCAACDGTGRNRRPRGFPWLALSIACLLGVWLIELAQMAVEDGPGRAVVVLVGLLATGFVGFVVGDLHQRRKG